MNGCVNKEQISLPKTSNSKLHLRPRNGSRCWFRSEQFSPDDSRKIKLTGENQTMAALFSLKLRSNEEKSEIAGQFFSRFIVIKSNKSQISEEGGKCKHIRNVKTSKICVKCDMNNLICNNKKCKLYSILLCVTWFNQNVLWVGTLIE